MGENDGLCLRLWFTKKKTTQIVIIKYAQEWIFYIVSGKIIFEIIVITFNGMGLSQCV